MNHQLRFSIWFPIVLVAAFAAGYLFWQQTLVPGPYDVEPVSVVRNHGTADVDTGNWQTYRNERYGFEVRYPDSWVVTENLPIAQGEKMAAFIEPPGLGPETRGFGVGFRVRQGEQYSFYGAQDVEAEPIVVNGYPARQMITRPSSYCRSKEVELLYGGNVYTIFIYSCGDGEIEDQILSTFKFIK